MQTNQLPSLSMYNIMGEHIAIIHQLEENGGELTPEIEMQMQLTGEQFEAKAISYGYVIKKFEDEWNLVQKEVERLQLLQRALAKKETVFMDRLSEAMQRMGVESVKSPTLKLSFRNSEAIEVLNEREIPADYIDSKVVSDISKTRIKAAIKAGIEVPGAALVQNKNLQIK